MKINCPVPKALPIFTYLYTMNKRCLGSREKKRQAAWTITYNIIYAQPHTSGYFTHHACQNHLRIRRHTYVVSANVATKATLYDSYHREMLPLNLSRQLL